MELWDDDSQDDGCNEDDLLGSQTVQIDREGGTFDQLIKGSNQYRPFRICFRYEAVFPPEPSELLVPLKDDSAAESNADSAMQQKVELDQHQQQDDEQS